MSEVTLPVGWKHSSLIRLAEYHNGAAFNPKHWGEDGLPIIRIEQINDPNAPTDFYNGPLIPQNRIGNGDLIFSWSATLKAVLWKHGEGALNQHLFKVVPRPGTNKEFLFQVLDYHMERIASGSHGSTMKHITRRELQRYNVQLPESEDRQRRIAEILTTVDEAMEQTEALVGKLEQMKAGLMHDLFTRGVTPDGHLRPTSAARKTKFGWIPSAWRTGSLLDVASATRQAILTGPFGADMGNDDFVAEGVPVLRIGNVQAGRLDLDDLLFVSEGKARTLERYKVREGDLLFARQGATTGRNALASAEVTGWLINYHIIRVALDHSLCSPLFIEAAFNGEVVKRQVERDKGRGTREGINSAQLKALALPMTDFDEQQHITRILRAHESKLLNAQATLDKLRQQKQGLMQDLLTGRVRVEM